MCHRPLQPALLKVQPPLSYLLHCRTCKGVLVAWLQLYRVYNLRVTLYPFTLFIFSNLNTSRAGVAALGSASETLPVTYPLLSRIDRFCCQVRAIVDLTRTEPRCLFSGAFSVQVGPLKGRSNGTLKGTTLSNLGLCSALDCACREPSVFKPLYPLRGVWGFEKQCS